MILFPLFPKLSFVIDSDTFFAKWSIKNIDHFLSVSPSFISPLRRSPGFKDVLLRLCTGGGGGRSSGVIMSKILDPGSRLVRLLRSILTIFSFFSSLKVAFSVGSSGIRPVENSRNRRRLKLIVKKKNCVNKFWL